MHSKVHSRLCPYFSLVMSSSIVAVSFFPLRPTCVLEMCFLVVSSTVPGRWHFSEGLLRAAPGFPYMSCCWDLFKLSYGKLKNQRTEYLTKLQSKHFIPKHRGRPKWCFSFSFVLFFVLFCLRWSWGWFWWSWWWLCS